MIKKVTQRVVNLGGGEMRMVSQITVNRFTQM